MLSAVALAAAGSSASSSALPDTLLIPPGHAYTFGPTTPKTVANGALRRVPDRGAGGDGQASQGMEANTVKGPKCQALSKAPAFCSGLTSVHVPFHGSDKWAFYLDGLARSAIEFNYSASPALTTTGITEEVPKACAAVMQALTCARYFQRCDPDNPELPEVDFCPCRSLCDQLRAMACPAADELDCSAQFDGPTMSCFSSETTCTGYTLIATDGALRLGSPAPSEETEEEESLRSTLEEELAQEAGEQAAAAAVEARTQKVAAAQQAAEALPEAEAEADAVAQPNAQTAQEGSADGAARCRKWAQSGECEANPAYMETECRQACATQQRAEEGARAVVAAKVAQEAYARRAAGLAETDRVVAARAVAAPAAAPQATPSNSGLGDKPFATPSYIVAARAAANVAGEPAGDTPFATPSYVVAARAAAKAAAEAAGDRPFATPSYLVAAKAASEARASTSAMPSFGGSATAPGNAAATALAAAAALATEKPWQLGINGVQPPPFATASVEAATRAALGSNGNGIQPLPFAMPSVELAARAAARVSAAPRPVSVEEAGPRL